MAGLTGSVPIVAELAEECNVSSRRANPKLLQFTQFSVANVPANAINSIIAHALRLALAAFAAPPLGEEKNEGSSLPEMVRRHDFSEFISAVNRSNLPGGG